VILPEVTGQHAQIIKATKKTVNEDNGGITSRLLRSLQASIQFHGKVLFFYFVWLGYHNGILPQCRKYSV
jgi:hypothetical protein